MIAVDEDALICDFAETYHIYDIYQLPCDYIATLACGLRADSRIMMAMSGRKVEFRHLLWAHIADNTAITAWLNSENAEKGKDRPPSFVAALLNKVDESDELRQFESGADFDKEWERIQNG